MRGSIILSLLTLCLFAAATARAGTIVYDFNAGSFGDLSITHDPGFSATAAGGVANLSNTTGAGNGSVIVDYPTPLSGDFTASVQADRTGIGIAEMGMHMENVTNLFFVRSDLIASNAFQPFVHTVFQDANTSAAATFTISRVGNTVTTIYNTGSGSISHSESDPSLAAPVLVGFFLLEEFGNTSGHSGTFDHFTLTNAAVPEPSGLGLLAIPLTLCARAADGVCYFGNPRSDRYPSGRSTILSFAAISS